MDAILGYLVALTLSMIGVAGFTTWARLGVANVQTAATASQMLTFDKAAQQYVQDNGTTIATIATATSPVTVTPAMLIAAGYLPNGFSPNNVFGQTWQLQVLQPAAGQLQSLVTSQGGTPISNTRQLVQIAAQAGAQGGFVPYANQAGDPSMSPVNANGAYGGWKLPLANYTNPGSGHLASLLAFTNVQSNNAYLYRVAVAGHPELNTMQTTLNMGTHDIDSANNVNATNVNAQGVDVQNPGGPSVVTVGNSKLVGVGSQAVLQADGGTVLTTSAGTYAPLTAGDVTANYIQPNGSAVVGQPCPRNGMIGNSGTGPLFCQSGVWQAAGEKRQCNAIGCVETLADGTMIESGTGSCAAQTAGQWFPFPVPFPNARLSAVASIGELISTSNPVTIGIDSNTLGMSVTCSYVGGLDTSSRHGFYWMAMGY